MSVKLTKGQISSVAELEEALKTYSLSDLIFMGSYSKKADELFEQVGKKYKKITSNTQFLKAFKENRLFAYEETTAEKYIGNYGANALANNFLSISSPDFKHAKDKKFQIISSWHEDKALPTTLAVPYGTKRLMNVSSHDLNDKNDSYIFTGITPGDYIYAKVGNKWDYYKKENFYIWNGTEFIQANKFSFDENGINELQNQTTQLIVQVGNTQMKVDSLLTTKTFNLTAVTEINASTGKSTPVAESVDINTGNYKQFVLDANGDVVSDEGVVQFKQSKLEPLYSKITYTSIDVETETGTVSQPKLAAKMYSLQNNGTNIKVRLKGYGTTVLVSVKENESELFKDPTCTQPIEFKDGVDRSIIGSEVYVKLKGDETVYTTERVTEHEAVLTYDTHRTMQPSLQKNDRLSDDAYLRLVDGSYVKEKDFVNPTAYNFVQDQTSTNFDAYLYYYEVAGKTLSVILPIDIASKGFPTTVEYNGSKVNIPANPTLYKIKKSTKALAQSDIIQTTSTRFYGMCEGAVTLVKQPIINEETKNLNNLEDTEDKTSLLNKARAEFEELYKKGIYDVEEVVVNGKIVKLDELKHSDNARYLLTDTILLDDPLSERPQYKFMKDGEMHFDPKTGLVIGGPKFDMAKANVEWFATAWEFAKAPIIATSLMLGVIGAVLGPVGVVGAIGVFVGGFAIGPIVNLIRKARYTRHIKQFKSHVNEARKALEKDTALKLATIYEQVKTDCNDIENAVDKYNISDSQILEFIKQAKQEETNKYINENGLINFAMEDFSNEADSVLNNVSTLKELATKLGTGVTAKQLQQMKIFKLVKGKFPSKTDNEEYFNLNVQALKLELAKRKYLHGQISEEDMAKIKTEADLQNVIETLDPAEKAFLFVDANNLDSIKQKLLSLGVDESKLTAVVDIKSAKDVLKEDIDSKVYGKATVERALALLNNNLNEEDRIMPANYNEALNVLRERGEPFALEDVFKQAIASKNQQIKATSKAAVKQRVLDTYAQLMAQVEVALGETSAYSKFEVKDGEAQINQQNAHQYAQYVSKLKQIKKELKAVEKDLTKNPDDKELLARKNSLIYQQENISTTYRSTGESFTIAGQEEGSHNKLVSKAKALLTKMHIIDPNKKPNRAEMVRKMETLKATLLIKAGLVEKSSADISAYDFDYDIINDKFIIHDKKTIVNEGEKSKRLKRKTRKQIIEDIKKALNSDEVKKAVAEVFDYDAKIIKQKQVELANNEIEETANNVEELNEADNVVTDEETISTNEEKTKKPRKKIKPAHLNEQEEQELETLLVKMGEFSTSYDKLFTESGELKEDISEEDQQKFMENKKYILDHYELIERYRSNGIIADTEKAIRKKKGDLKAITKKQLEDTDAKFKGKLTAHKNAKAKRTSKAEVKTTQVVEVLNNADFGIEVETVNETEV